MTPWTAFNYQGEYVFDAARVKKYWLQLHAGDLEPLPNDEAVLAAWAQFHGGAFQKATELGLQAGSAGSTVANKATCIYANYLEPKEKNRQTLFLQVAERAAAQSVAEPGNPNAYYWQAYALGRYSQGISVAKALAQGVGGKIKSALEKTIALQPQHADAHVALGAFHAEVIDKVGALIAAGYPSGYEDEAYRTVSGQNSNNSIRIPNSFFQVLEEDGDWELKGRMDGRVMKKIPARELWNQIAYAAWR